jgi:hypothetical protein
MPLEEEFHHAMISVADFANAHNFVIRFRQMIQEWSARCGEADRALFQIILALLSTVNDVNLLIMRMLIICSE